MHMPAGALKQDEMLPRRRMENNPHSREHHGSHLEKMHRSDASDASEEHTPIHLRVDRVSRTTAGALAS